MIFAQGDVFLLTHKDLMVPFFPRPKGEGIVLEHLPGDGLVKGGDALSIDVGPALGDQPPGFPGGVAQAVFLESLVALPLLRAIVVSPACFTAWIFHRAQCISTISALHSST